MREGTRLLRHLLPALVPSWGFFDVIGPSPRLDFAWDDGVAAPAWREFRPPPSQLRLRQAFASLFWNARGNERLFLLTCCERWLEQGERAIAQEIMDRLARSPEALAARPVTRAALRFRIRIVEMKGERLTEAVAYTSPAHEPRP